MKNLNIEFFYPEFSLMMSPVTFFKKDFFFKGFLFIRLYLVIFGSAEFSLLWGLFL